MFQARWELFKCPFLDQYYLFNEILIKFGSEYSHFLHQESVDQPLKDAARYLLKKNKRLKLEAKYLLMILIDGQPDKQTTIVKKYFGEMMQSNLENSRKALMLFLQAAPKNIKILIQKTIHFPKGLQVITKRTQNKYIFRFMVTSGRPGNATKTRQLNCTYKSMYRTLY